MLPYVNVDPNVTGILAGHPTLVPKQDLEGLDGMFVGPQEV